jgi:hypothetical protein
MILVVSMLQNIMNQGNPTKPLASIGHGEGVKANLQNTIEAEFVTVTQ